MYFNKKTIAILAGVVSLALIVTGTFAWCLQEDITKLNKFTWTGERDQEITVDLEEEFSPWLNKDMYVSSESDSTDPAIVRVRFEEFVKVTGGSMDVDANAIFKASALNNYKADSATAPKAVELLFSNRTMTMAKWIERGKPLEDENGAAYWVLDTNGWCYYTKPLNPGEKSELLLDNVMKKGEDKSFLNSIYGGNEVEMDFYVNVRLQAMSVDLSSYALEESAEDYPRDWANKNGSEITKYNNGYDIIETSKITDNADELVRAVNSAYNASVNKNKKSTEAAEN